MLSESSFLHLHGENDLMTKVHQKVPGCFPAKEEAAIFCRARIYLSSCRKNNVFSNQSLTFLLDGT